MLLKRKSGSLSTRPVRGDGGGETYWERMRSSISLRTEPWYLGETSFCDRYASLRAVCSESEERSEMIWSSLPSTAVCSSSTRSRSCSLALVSYIEGGAGTARVGEEKIFIR